MRLSRIAVAGVVATWVLGSSALAQTVLLEPMEIDWRDNEGSLVDLSFLLDRPAGRHGPARVEGGHILRGDRKRLRIWGVNLTGAACFPEAEDASIVADHLARYGINCVRFHFLDSDWGREATVFDAARDDTQALDPGQMERLDRFIAELKERGIYSNLNLNVGRVYRRGDGVVDFDSIGFGKAIQYYDDRVAELHREYAKLLLTHRNPFTGSEYRQEPAILIVELVNENSLIESWFSGRLRGRHTGPSGGTWSDVTAHYAALLTRKYNDWLQARLSSDELAALRRAAGVGDGEPVPRLDPDEFSEAPTARFHAEARFYMELEDAYFQRMNDTLRELGVTALGVGTSDHNHYRSGYALLASTSRLDVVDGHVYWQHPSYRRVDGRTAGFWIPNTPMVNDPLSSTVVQLARSPVLGKPYTVSETNHPFPNEFACEGIPILAAYGLLQDWDGTFLYTFEHQDPRQWASRTPGHFDIRADPVRMANLAAAALMVHRGDVRPASRVVSRSYGPAQVIEAIRMDPSERPLFTPGLSRALPLAHGLRIDSFGGTHADVPPSGAPWSPQPAETPPFVSDTGELTWRLDDGKGLVTIDTDRTVGLVGFAGGQPVELTSVTARVENDFCAVIVTSLDGEPVDRAERLLVTATARSETTGMRRNEDRTSLDDWGRPPFRIEPVRGTVSIRRSADGPALELVPLNGAGKALGKASKVPARAGTCELRLRSPTTWYLVRESDEG